MTRRLQPILELIVSPAQRAFVPNRSIVSNILICQDLVRGYSRATSSPRCLMKVDLRKAYDSVEWIFVERVLLALGFPSMFVQRLMTCLSTAQYSVIVNGTPYGFFKGGRGLRQGDPISP